MNDNPSVVVRLQGGLGNQLFQYAAGLSIARELGATLSFRGPGGSGSQLDRFIGNRLDMATPSVLRHLAVTDLGSTLPKSVLRIRRRWLLSRGAVTHLRQTDSESFEPIARPIIKRRGSSMYLDGYFQHPSWFESSLHDVAGYLSDVLEDCVPPGIGKGVTLLSIRRGDYVQLGWDLPLTYYDRALKLVPPDSPLWVVGDDDLVCNLIEERLRRAGFTVDPKPDLSADKVKRDLALISVADQVIMSNSTFCWWGVAAGDPDSTRTGRVVVAPDAWIPLKGSASVLRDDWTMVRDLSNPDATSAS